VDDIERPMGRITIWTRLAAGLFFFIFLMVPFVTIRALLGGHSLAIRIPWYEVAFVILFMVAFIPAVASVAFRGRLPKYWLDMEHHARGRRRRQPISIFWRWNPHVPRWVRRTFLILLALIPGAYATVITLNSITRGIDGRQLALLILVWLLAIAVIVSVLRWWRSLA